MSKKYFNVEIVETLRRVVPVEAEDELDAHQKVSDGWRNSQYILEADDFAGCDINVLSTMSEENINWLSWDELTEAQKEQAQESYMLMRETEEERTRDDVFSNPDYDEPIDPEGVKSCRFEILEDGYVYVDL